MLLNSSVQFKHYLYDDQINLLRFLTLYNNKNRLLDCFDVYILPKCRMIHNNFFYFILGGDLLFDYNFLLKNFYNLKITSTVSFFYKNRYLFHPTYIKYDYKIDIQYILYFPIFIMKYHFFLINNFNFFLLNIFYKTKLFLFNFFIYTKTTFLTKPVRIFI